MRSIFLSSSLDLWEIWFFVWYPVCSVWLHCCTAYHISPSEVLRWRDGVLYRSSKLWCSLRQSESQWSLIRIEIYLCRWSVLSICKEFLSSRRQRVVVDGATSEWIPIVSGMLQGSVLCSFLLILYSSKVFELVENRLYSCANDSTLLAVSVGQQTELRLLPLLSGTWQGFRSGAVTGARYWILTKLRLQLFVWKPFLRWYCLPCLSENWYFEAGETIICWHLCVASLLFCICSPNPWVLFSGVGVSCWNPPSASWVQSVFGV